MSYELSQDIQQRVEAQIATGAYRSRDEVLREAMDALELQNADIAAIAAGIEDERAGRMTPITEVEQAMREKFGISAKR